jgi:hypothetical protein
MPVDARPSPQVRPGAGGARVVAAPDGSLVAVRDGDRVVVHELPDLAVVSEIGIDPEAETCEAAFVADPARLIVCATYDDHSVLHVVDPRGPQQLGELEIRAPMRLVAASGDHALLASATASVIVDCTRADLVAAPLPLRVAISAAGAHEPDKFVLSAGGIVEEWDAVTRAPLRRFRLGRPVVARHIGGDSRQVWSIPQPDGGRVEIIPLVNRGQPQRIDLPEGAARAVMVPQRDLLLVVGEQTGTLFAVDLTGRQPVAELEAAGEDVAARGGRGAAAVIVRAGEEPRVLALGGDDGALDAGEEGEGDDESPTLPPKKSVALTAPPPADTTTVAERLIAWRERMRASLPRDGGRPEAVAIPERSTWRDDVASWARTVVAGTQGDVPQIGGTPLATAIERLGLDSVVARAAILLYGAHLCGLDGVAPVDLAGALAGRWDEALGRGDLAASGAARWRRSRVRLAAEVLAMIDERPPRRGVVVGEGPPAFDDARAVIAPPDVPLDALAVSLVARTGALLVARDDARPERLALEAAVRALTPMLRDRAPAGRAVVVVAEEADARRFGLAILERWTGR